MFSDRAISKSWYWFVIKSRTITDITVCFQVWRTRWNVIPRTKIEWWQVSVTHDFEKYFQEPGLGRVEYR